MGWGLIFLFLYWPSVAMSNPEHRSLQECHVGHGGLNEFVESGNLGVKDFQNVPVTKSDPEGVPFKGD